MIDYRERIKRYHDALRTHYNVVDTQAADIIAAIRLVPRQTDPRLQYLWIILETSWYGGGRTNDPWYFADGGAVDSLLRVRQLAYAEVEVSRVITQYLPHSGSLLLVEPMWEARWDTVSQASKLDHIWVLSLEQRCLRVRSTHPKNNLVPTDALPKVTAAVKEVLDCRWRVRAPDLVPLAPHLLYYLEIAQKTTDRLNDWDTVVANLSALQSRLAWLRNKPAPDDEETADLERVIRDSVPHMWHQVIPRITRPTPHSTLYDWAKGFTWIDADLPIRDSWFARFMSRAERTGFVRTVFNNSNRSTPKWRLVHPDAVHLCDYSRRLPGRRQPHNSAKKLFA